MLTKSNGANAVELRTYISPAINSALDQLVQLTGVSKASLVRQALATMLAAQDVLPPAVALSVRPTPSSGRLASQKKKEI